MKKVTLILISLLVISCNNSKEIEAEGIVQDDTFIRFRAVLDQYAKDMINKGNANSFALAIYKDGQVYQNYYGEIDKGGANKPSDSTRYEIASITKTFTGALVAKTVLEGKLGLDDDIRNYLEGDYPNLQFEGEPVTIKDLLTHSIGFDNENEDGLYAMSNKINRGPFKSSEIDYSITDFYNDLKQVKITNKPGTIYAYNSVGPELLAFILEKVNEQTFDQQLQVFLNELGMHNTYMQGHDEKHKNLINGYKGEKLVTINVSPFTGAAGGAISTLPDLSIYMQYLIDHKNEPWVKEASRTLFVDPEDGEQIGYLWQEIGVAEEEGSYYSKTGTANGTQSGILLCPGSDYGIVLLVNNTSEAAFRDWATLFFYDIEPDLIKYPKLNLFSTLKTEFLQAPEEAISKFRALKTDTTNYYLRTRTINSYGYRLLGANQEGKALTIFKFITEEFPDNANAYDSLGEAYFITEDYENALINYKRALELNPKNDNAKNYIIKIQELVEGKL